MVNWLLFHPTVGRHRKKQTAKKRCICSSCIFLFSLAWNTNFVSKFQPLKMILTTDTWLYSYLLTDNLIVLFTLEIKACLKISCSGFFFPLKYHWLKSIIILFILAHLTVVERDFFQLFVKPVLNPFISTPNKLKYKVVNNLCDGALASTIFYWKKLLDELACLEQQHQHQLGTCLQCTFSDPAPDLLSWKSWG